MHNLLLFLAFLSILIFVLAYLYEDFDDVSGMMADVVLV
jgi:hypothetical protein